MIDPGGKPNSGSEAVDELGATLRSLSDASATRGDAEAMQRHALELLALARRRADRTAEAEAINRLGVAYLRSDQIDDARCCFEQALDLYRQTDSGTGEERVLANLGIVFTRSSNPERAIESYTTALQARPASKARYAHAGFLSEIARLEYRRGRPAAALAILRRRLALIVELDDEAIEAETRLRIGGVQAELWKVDEARRELDRGRQIASRLPERELEGLALNYIGRLLEQTGDADGARQFFERALKIAVAAGHRHLERLARNNLAMATEDGEERLSQLESVVQFARELEDRQAEALAENNLAHTLNRMGRAGDAERHYQQALSINESLGDVPGLTRVENNLALLHLPSMPERAGEPVPWYKPHRRRRLVRLDRGSRIWVWYMTLGIRLSSWRSQRIARAQYEQSLTRHEHDGNAIGVVTALQNLAIIELHRGKHAQAFIHFRRLLEKLERARGEVAAEEIQTQFFATQQHLFDTVMPLLLFRRRDEEAFELAERARSRALFDMITTQPGREETPASRWIELGERLRASDQALRTTDPADPRHEQLKAEIADIEWELRGINRSLAPDSEAAVPLATVERVQKELLDDGTALLEYRLSAHKGILFCITRNRFKVFDLHGVSEIEARVRELVAAVSAGLHRYPHGSELYQSLIRPAERLLRRESVSSLLIVADGVLNSLPFSLLLTEEQHADAIVDPEARLSGLALAHRVEQTLPLQPYHWGSLSLLMRRYAIGHVPSASIGLAISSRPALTRPARLAAFAAISNELKHSVEEVRTIERLIKEFDGSTAGHRDGVLVRTGPAATKEEFLRLLRSHPFSFIHLATHGLLNEERPLLSGLMFASSREDDLNPHLLVLDLGEVEIEAEIVILSACETGLGKLVKGEGMVGLSRAFLGGGARSLCVSLWKVPDRSTPKLMTHLYQELLAGHNRCEALRGAQLQMLEDPVFAHPFHWASFVMTGACTKPVPLATVEATLLP
ncbi:MAG TPA: CHAT domain-containing protein [Solirubrobacterales bacterium]